MKNTNGNTSNYRGFSSLIVFFLVGLLLLGVSVVVYFSLNTNSGMGYGGLSNSDKKTPSAGSSATVSTPMPTISADSSQSTIEKEIEETVLESVDSEFESLSTSVKDL